MSDSTLAASKEAIQLQRLEDQKSKASVVVMQLGQAGLLATPHQDHFTKTLEIVLSLIQDTEDRTFDKAVQTINRHVGYYDDHYMHCLTKCIPEELEALKNKAGVN